MLKTLFAWLILINAAVSNIITVRPVSDAMYIRIKTFDAPNISAILLEKLSNYQYTQPSSYIIDLRNNSGGYLDEAIQTCALFTSKQDLLTIITADGSRKIVTRTPSHPFYNAPKRIVLTNAKTASAAEACLAILHTMQSTITYGKESMKKTTITSTTSPPPYQSFELPEKARRIDASIPNTDLNNTQLLQILAKTAPLFDPPSHHPIQ